MFMNLQPGEEVKTEKNPADPTAHPHSASIKGRVWPPWSGDTVERVDGAHKPYRSGACPGGRGTSLLPVWAPLRAGSFCSATVAVAGTLPEISLSLSFSLTATRRHTHSRRTYRCTHAQDSHTQGIHARRARVGCSCAHAHAHTQLTEDTCMHTRTQLTRVLHVHTHTQLTPYLVCM